MNTTLLASKLFLISGLFLLVPALAAAAEQTMIRAALQPEDQRKLAPEFTLKDAKGKTVKLKNYRGKAILLDFWATWCGGCKEEIPWFAEFQKRYGAKGFAVVGVSVDEGGWKVLKPFLAENKVPYRMLLGNDAMMQSYRITNLPDTFLIDKHGKIAAAYTAGLVNREDIETNIKAILTAH